MAKPTALGKRGSRLDAALRTPPAGCRFVRAIPSLTARGFTLIELMIVISIIAILLAIAIPSFGRSIVAARERTLRSELATLRKAIWDYTFDKQRAPKSLDDLVTGGYLTKIPTDPITRETNWEPVEEEVLIVVDEQESGIIDVHSASENSASDGTAYNTW